MRCICGERLALEVYTTEDCAAELIAHCSKCNPEVAEVEKVNKDSIIENQELTCVQRVIEIESVIRQIKQSAVQTEKSRLVDCGILLFIVVSIFSIAFFHFSFQEKIDGFAATMLVALGLMVCLAATLLIIDAGGLSLKEGEKAEAEFWEKHPRLKADWEDGKRRITNE